MEKQKKEPVEKHQQLAHRCVKKDEVALNVSMENNAMSSFSNIVRSLLQGWRQGTVGVKGRSDVKISAELRQPRVAGKKVLKSAKKQVFASLLSHKIQREEVTVVNWQLGESKPKTKDVAHMLRAVGLQDKKTTFFMSENDYLLAASCANIPNVYALAFDQPNAYSMALGKQWIVLEKDLHLFKDMVSQWN